LFHQLGAQLVAQAQRPVAPAAEPDHSSHMPEIAVPLLGDRASGDGA
jgi:hypothetical protein